jgi:hypothetical protein
MVSQELLKRLNDYIGHAHHVHSTTHKEYRTSIAYGKKLDQITWCRNKANGINRFSGAHNISRLILAMRTPLKDILPYELNSSYQHSLQEYNDLILTCERVLNEV